MGWNVPISSSARCSDGAFEWREGMQLGGGNLRKDGFMELLDLEPRLDSQVLAKALADDRVLLQCLSLAARGVEGQHQLGSEGFVELVAGDGLLQFGDDLTVVSLGYLVAEQVLVSGDPLAFQQPGFLLDCLAGDTGQGIAAPDRDRVAQPRRRAPRVSQLGLFPSLV